MSTRLEAMLLSSVPDFDEQKLNSLRVLDTLIIKHGFSFQSSKKKLPNLICFTKTLFAEVAKMPIRAKYGIFNTRDELLFTAFEGTSFLIKHQLISVEGLYYLRIESISMDLWFG